MNKKLLTLLWVYASWVVAALLYNKKSPAQIKTELDTAKESGEKNIKVLFNNFIEIHQNLLDTLKTKLLTEENKAKFYAKKDDFISLALDFKSNSEKIFEEYKNLGKDYSTEWIQKLEQFYTEKLNEVEELKKKTPEKIEAVKIKIIAYYEDIKSKMKK